MPGVAPEIIEQTAAPGDVRDVVGPVEDGAEGIAVGLERRAGQARERRGVLRVDPGEGVRAVDLLQPEVGVGIRGFDGGAGIDGGAPSAIWVKNGLETSGRALRRGRFA